MNKMDSISEKIIEILNLIIKEKNESFASISVEQADDELMEWGIDSITFIRIVVALEEAFEIEIPDEKLLRTEMSTLNKIIDVISTVIKEKSE